jgi:hypothetical protein
MRRVLYDVASPIVLQDNLSITARADPSRIFIVPIGDIHIFIGDTNPAAAMESNFWRIGIVKTSIRIAFKLDTEEGRPDLELSKKFSILDL